MEQLDEQVDEVINQMRGNVKVQGPNVLNILLNHAPDDCSLVMKEARRGIEQIAPKPVTGSLNDVLSLGFDITRMKNDNPVLKQVIL